MVHALLLAMVIGIDVEETIQDELTASIIDYYMETNVAVDSLSSLKRRNMYSDSMSALLATKAELISLEHLRRREGGPVHQYVVKFRIGNVKKSHKFSVALPKLKNIWHVAYSRRANCDRDHSRPTQNVQNLLNLFALAIYESREFGLSTRPSGSVSTLLESEKSEVLRRISEARHFRYKASGSPQLTGWIVAWDERTGLQSSYPMPRNRLGFPDVISTGKRRKSN